MPTFNWGSIKFQGHFWNISQPFLQISWCPEIPRDLSEIILEIISENISKNISDRYPRWRFHGIWRFVKTVEILNYFYILSIITLIWRCHVPLNLIRSGFCLKQSALTNVTWQSTCVYVIQVISIDEHFQNFVVSL